MRNKKLEIGKETETEMEMEMVVTLNFFDIHNNIDITFNRMRVVLNVNTLFRL